MGERKNRGGRVRADLLLAIAVYIFGACFFFRQQIFSGFDLYFGDLGDPRLILFIHEHVYRALLGEASFLSPPEFHDLTNTLGGSDAFVLNQLFYTPLRLLGADPYLAIVLGIVALSALGFFTMCGVLTRWFDVPLAIAAPVTVLVIFPNNLAGMTAHIQNFVIYFAPLLIWWVLYGVTEIHRQPARAGIAAAAAGLLYGLMLATGFYIPWFLGIGFGFFAIIFAMSDPSATIRWWRRNPLAIARLLLCGLAGFAVGVSVFAMIYLPVLQGTGGWSFQQYLDGAFTFTQLLDLGPRNLLWGWLERLLFTGHGAIAITPIASVCILASFFLCLRRRLWIEAGAEFGRRVVLAASLTAILLVLFTIKAFDFSLYVILHALVPGARAIRLADRMLVVVSLFSAVAIAVTLARLAATRLIHADRSRRRILVGLLLTLLVLEQVNLGRIVSVSRAAEAAHFSALRRAPSYCRAFFVTPQPALTESENQTDALMAAHRTGLPTLNGTTGIAPSGYPLARLMAADYQPLALAWAATRGTLDGLCRLDIPTGEWLPSAALDPGPRLSAGDTIAITNTGQWNRILVAGWWTPEEWGVWSEGPEAKLLLPLVSSGDPTASLEITAGGFVRPGHPPLTVTVTAAGETLAVWQFVHGGSDQNLVLDIPRRLVSSVGVLLTFQIAPLGPPRRPSAADDGRRLGLGLQKIRVIR